MELKARTESVHFVDSNDLEEFIKAHTGQCYDCVCSEEWSNDSQHRFTVKPFGEYSEYVQKKWAEFKAGGRDEESYVLSAILDGLCNEGKLAAGTYVITVCW